MYSFVHALPIENPSPLSGGIKAMLIESIKAADLSFSEHVNSDSFRWMLSRLAIDTPAGFDNRVVNLDGEALETKQLFLARAKAIQAGDIDRYMYLNTDIIADYATNFIAGKLINPSDRTPAWFLAKVHRTKDYLGVVNTSYVMLITIDAQPNQGDHPKWFDVKIDHSLMNAAVLKDLKRREISSLSQKTIAALGYVLPTALISLLEFP